MSVNVSPAQMLQSGFVRKVGQCLERTGLPSNMLCVELTESLFLGRSLTSVRTILDEMHTLGVTLALDDFGTGYSSLAYLKRFPVNKLKIDQSFVRHVVEDTDDQAIASTIVSIGKSLRLTVLAEGVETKAQLAWLCAQRCDFAQGYHFSPPLPPEDMAAMLRRQPFLTGE
jgi:EAL domain-containing protein (putative c-di-GMP-specific phosphodiesterase class I)